MHGICSDFAQNMPRLCLNFSQLCLQFLPRLFAQVLSRLYLVSVQTILSICFSKLCLDFSQYAQTLPKLCSNSAQYAQTFPNYAQILPKLCLNYAQTLPKLSLNISQTKPKPKMIPPHLMQMNKDVEISISTILK